MAAQSSSRTSAISKRGIQLAASTVLGVFTIALALAVVALGMYEMVHHGTSAWMVPYAGGNHR